MRFSVSGSVGPKDIGHLKGTSHRKSPFLMAGLLLEQIDGAPDPCNVLPRNVKIDGRGVRCRMTQKPLDVVQIGSGFQEMRCEAVSQGMHRGFLANARFFKGLLEDALNA